MLTLWGYIRYHERPGAYRYALILLLFTLGLMTKPRLVTLPFVLLLLDYGPLNRFSFRASHPRSLAQQRSSAALLVREKPPLLATAIAVSVVTLFVQHIRPLEAYPLSVRCVMPWQVTQATLGR